MEIVEIYDNNISALPFFDRPNLLFQVQRPRAPDCGHPKSFFRGNNFRIFANHFVQQRRRVDLFPYVEIVIRSGAVGAESHGQIVLQHLGDGSHS